VINDIQFIRFFS